MYRGGAEVHGLGVPYPGTPLPGHVLLPVSRLSMPAQEQGKGPPAMGGPLLLTSSNDSVRISRRLIGLVSTNVSTRPIS